MDIALLKPEFVLPSLLAKDKEEAIRALSTVLYKEGRLTELEVFIQEVMKREKEFSTGFGEGLAIPHGKTNVVMVPSVMVAKLPKKIPWDALDGEPVGLIFLLAVPEEATGHTHLKLLAKLAENLMDEKVRKELDSIQQRDELYHYVYTLLEGE